MSADALAVHRAVLQAAGPQSLADITRDLTDTERQLLNSEPVHRLVLAALDSDGRVVDQAAFAELQRIGDGGDAR
jgi:hypothetical protein